MTSYNVRSQNYLRQVKGGALYKIGAIGMTFLVMPIMIKYLGVEQFGVWTTMLTLITWVMLFDLGIGNGLKNRVSESLAQDNLEQVRGYISTAYGLIGVISLALFVLFSVIGNWLSWQVIFNTQSIVEEDLKNSVLALSFFIFLNFWIGLVNQIYHGLQKTSFVVLGQFLSNSFALVLVVLLSLFSDSSIFFMVCAYGLSVVLANFILTAYVLKIDKKLLPSARCFDRNKIKPLLSLGMKFFVIQIAALVIFTSDKILITQLLGPQYVTPYEVVFKLFSVITIAHGLILLPLWPAYSDAYQRGDLDWINKKIWQQTKISMALVLAALLMASLGPRIVDLWVGGEVVASKTLYYLFAVFIVVSVWSNVFAYFVNATNELGAQLYTSVLAAIINVPLSIYFVTELGLKLEGVILATIISLSIFAVVGPIQVFRIVKVGKI